MIVGLIILLSFLIAGNVLEKLFYLPVPGSVVGLFLLLLALISFDRLSNYVRPVALVLISYLALLFVPAGVGIMLHVDRIKNEALAISCSLLLSTVLSIVVCSLTIKYSMRWLEKRRSAKLNKQESSDGI